MVGSGGSGGGVGLVGWVKISKRTNHKLEICSRKARPDQGESRRTQARESRQGAKMPAPPDFVNTWKTRGWKFFYFFSGLQLLEKLPTLAIAKNAHQQGRGLIEKLENNAARAMAAYCPHCFGVEAVAVDETNKKDGERDAWRRLCSSMNKHAAPGKCKGEPARLVRAL